MRRMREQTVFQLAGKDPKRADRVYTMGLAETGALGEACQLHRIPNALVALSPTLDVDVSCSFIQRVLLVFSASPIMTSTLSSPPPPQTVIP